MRGKKTSPLVGPISWRPKRPTGRTRPLMHAAPGFTLIELLVAISIIALLMAILMPTLQRVRKQAKTVACQSNLRQWGILRATYAAENDGRLPGWDDRPRNPSDPGWGDWGGSGPDYGWWGWGGPEPSPNAKERYNLVKDIMCCPMATKPANPTDHGSLAGGTFLAWGWGGQALAIPRLWQLWREHLGPLVVVVVRRSRRAEILLVNHGCQDRRRRTPNAG